MRRTAHQCGDTQVARRRRHRRTYPISATSARRPVRLSAALGLGDIHFTAHWATRPWLDTWYYGGRIGVWSGDRGWLFYFTHHKIYLTNPPPAVQKFQVTNGVNQFTVSRGFRHGLFSYAFGAGPVITFPINKVRNQKLEGERGFWGGILSVRRQHHGQRNA